MKKFIYIIAAVAALFFLSSCEKADKSGKVVYNVGFSALSISGESASDVSNELARIESFYVTEFNKISGCSYSDGALTFNSIKYKTADNAVLDACKAAEKNVTLKLSGSVTLRVTALYYSNAEDKVIYEQTFKN